MNNDMNHDIHNYDPHDEMRDAELECVGAKWEAPAPGPGFHERVLAAYQTEFRRSAAPRRKLSLILQLAFTGAAALCAMAALFIAMSYAHKDRPNISNGSGNGSGPAVVGPYQPVHQPRFIVISQGEQP